MKTTIYNRQEVIDKFTNSYTINKLVERCCIYFNNRIDDIALNSATEIITTIEFNFDNVEGMPNVTPEQRKHIIEIFCNKLILNDFEIDKSNNPVNTDDLTYSLNKPIYINLN